MTSEHRKRPVTPFGMEPWNSWPGTPARSRTLGGLAPVVILSVVLLVLSIVASAFVVRTVSAALFSGGQSHTRSGQSTATAAQQSSLRLQSRLVERRRVVAAEYAAKLAEFKFASNRLPGAVGINLGAAEVRRREDLLAGLVLECIDAVGQYNLGAQTHTAAQLRSAGLPERYVWEVDCATGQ